MQKFNLFFAFVLVLILTGCGNNNSVDAGVDSDLATGRNEAGMTPEVSGKNPSAGETTVSLDNGKKWEANPETTEGIQKMIKSVQEVIKNDGANIEIYRALGASLQKDFNTIFEKCTMTGESHDQLHNYLLPMVNLVKTFEKEDLSACKKTLPLLKAHLGTYYSYFE